MTGEALSGLSRDLPHRAEGLQLPAREGGDGWFEVWGQISA